MWVHNLLTLSNFLGLPAVIILLKKERMLECFLVFLVIFASMLMHISEKKHNLSPMTWLRDWSETFLNLDRLVAVVNSIFWSCVWFKQRKVIGHYIFYRFLLGGLLATIGEWKTYGSDGKVYQQVLGIYIPLHLLWHAIVYYNLYEISINLE